jgi:hypothetical protein
MKHLHTLIVFLFVTGIYAQTTTTIFNHDQIYGNSMAIHGNEVYFPTETHILKIDHTQTNPSAVEVVEVEEAGDLLFHGDELYFSSISTISKIDVTAQTPTVVDVITSGLNDPRLSSMTFKGDELYFSDAYPIDGNEDGYRILKFDVTGSETAATVVFNNPNSGGNLIYGLGFYGNGNELYFTTSSVFTPQAGKVLKMNVSETSPSVVEVVAGLNNPYGIAFDGNDLYISEFGENKVFKIDVTEDSPSTTDVVSISGPDKLIIDGNNLFIASRDSENEIGHIIRYTDSTLAINNIDVQTLNLYPNPAQDKMYVSGIDNPQPFSIYNLLGAEVAKGSVSENTPIDIIELPKGMYFLRLGSGQALKFVKE